MRVILNVSVVLLCGALAGLSSLAQSAPTQAAVLPTAMPTSSGLVALASQTAPSPVSARHGGSIGTHFAAANTSHDGRLTQAQAEQAGWPRVAKHFDEIDTDHQGWITLDQIHAFNRSHRAHRKASPT